MSSSKTRNFSRSLLILFVGLATGAALTVGQGVFATLDDLRASEDTVPVDQLRNFVEILNRVKEDYVEDVSDEELIENAIRGMLDGLDPHSSYLSADEFKEVSISTSGRFGGLGIEVTMQHGFVRVVTPIDGTPADEAGVQAGDLIVRIDGTAVKGMGLMDAVKHMRGEPGTSISLTILREGQSEPFKVRIKRDIIRVQSVKSRMLDPGYGYVRVSQFSNRTGETLNDSIDRLLEEADGDFKGLVLDLRNNPGGVLNAAVDVSDAFMDGGEIVSIRGRGKYDDQTFNATAGDRLDGRPIVVLINEGSASASEIVAGALQDAGRAVVVGRRSFGKGSVQTIVPLQSEAALKLTTARYYTPDGRSIQAEGIAPDIEIQNVTVTAAKDNGMLPFSEADLVGALANGAEDDAPEGVNIPEEYRVEDEEPTRSLAEEDYALYEALNLLKGLYILSSR